MDNHRAGMTTQEIINPLWYWGNGFIKDGAQGPHKILYIEGRHIIFINLSSNGYIMCLLQVLYFHYNMTSFLYYNKTIPIPVTLECPD